MDEDEYRWRRVVPQSHAQLTTQSADSKARTIAAAKATKVLLGCYRSGEANDPEVYTTAVVATLARYPESVIREACDPRTGLPARSKWLPTVSEVRAECERLEAKNIRAKEWAEQAKRQLQERREAERAKEQDRPSLDELKAKYGKNWGLTAIDDAKKRRDADMDRVNRVIFEMECRAAGMSPDSPVSPALLRTLEGK